MLDAWRETTLFSSRERAALAWTEALTRLCETRAPDADYEAMAARFDTARVAERLEAAFVAREHTAA